MVGQQTRRHRDLDLAFNAGYEDIAIEVLGVLGYALETDWRPVRFELAAPPSRFGDMHPVVLDDDGNGVQAGPDGTTFFYPSTSFSTGVVAGRFTNCISVDLQVRFTAATTRARLIEQMLNNSIESLPAIAARADAQARSGSSYLEEC